MVDTKRRVRRRRGWAAPVPRVGAGAPLLWLLTLGCAGLQAPSLSNVSFDTASVWIQGQGDPVHLLVEVADDERRQSLGLMYRDSLDRDSGMLFVHDADQEASRGFWMWRTRIPLDIAFIDGDGVIRRILSMEPCPLTYADDCPAYVPGVPYRYALEVNRGWFEARGVGVGARAVLDRDGPPPP